MTWLQELEAENAKLKQMYADPRPAAWRTRMAPTPGA